MRLKDGRTNADQESPNKPAEIRIFAAIPEFRMTMNSLTFKFVKLNAFCVLVMFLFGSRSTFGEGGSANQVAPNEKLTFETTVRPILKAYCLDCHGGTEKLSGG